MSRSLKRILVILSLLLLGVILFAGYVVVQALGQVAFTKVVNPNSVEAEEASRKMRRFEDSLQTGKQGYIRLNEAELNSILENRFFPALKSRKTESKTDGPELTRVLVGLGGEEMTWHYWVKVPWAGRNFQLALRHAVRPRYEEGRWVFETASLRVGRLGIPSRYWSKLEQSASDGSNPISKPQQWLTSLPALDLTTNPVNSRLELCLYNYPAPEILKKYKK